MRMNFGRHSDIEGIVFDMDGTVFDTEGLKQLGLKIGESVAGFLSSTPTPSVPLEGFREVVGVSQDQWPVLGPKLLGENWKLVKRGRDEALVEFFKLYGAPWCEGAKELLKYLVEIDMPRGLNTTSKREPLGLAITEKRQLGDYLPVMIFGDDVAVGKGKPMPDSYLLACNKLGIDPSKAFAVEDSERGLQAARNAGMIVVAVPGIVPLTAEGEALADYIYPSLVEFHADLRKAVEA